MLENIDAVEFLSNFKTYLNKSNRKDLTGNFLWEDFQMAAKVWNLEHQETEDLLQVYIDAGIIKYLGSLGPPDCPDMFNEFTFIS